MCEYSTGVRYEGMVSAYTQRFFVPRGALEHVPPERDNYWHHAILRGSQCLRHEPPRPGKSLHHSNLWTFVSSKARLGISANESKRWLQRTRKGRQIEI